LLKERLLTVRVFYGLATRRKSTMTRRDHEIGWTTKGFEVYCSFGLAGLSCR
jgi:hypothetical protein